MSVLIKDMAMPTGCGLCRFDDYGYCTIAKQYSGGSATHGVASFCPLVEVKTPHGRLVDQEDISKMIRNPYEWNEVMRWVKDAPTIIEAEGGE